MVSTRGVRYKFTEGERVLCYEPDPTKAKVLYDSKVLEVIESKDKRGRRTVEYLIHFQGWNSSWDRSVSEDFVLKDTEENRQLQRDLAEKSQLQLGAYLYRRERKKGNSNNSGSGPAKRPRHGFSDDGSSTSTQPDEDEGDTGDTDSSSGSGSSQPQSPPNSHTGRANIVLTSALRDRLTFDYHLVVKRGRVSRLPASPCAAQILESFVKWFARAGAWNPPRARHDPHHRPDMLDVSCRLNLLREVADGLRVYFDFILRAHLLYKQEQDQYYEFCGRFIDEPNIKTDPDEDEKDDSLDETLASIERSMKSPKIPEYSHLPPDPKPDLKPIIKTEKPGLKPIVKTEMKPDVKPVIKPNLKSVVKSNLKPVMKPDTNHNSRQNSHKIGIISSDRKTDIVNLRPISRHDLRPNSHTNHHSGKNGAENHENNTKADGKENHIKRNEDLITPKVEVESETELEVERELEIEEGNEEKVDNGNIRTRIRTSPRHDRQSRALRHRILARRLRSHKSIVSENEEPAPSTSTGGQRTFETLSSSAASSGSSLSEGWARDAAPPPAPAAAAAAAPAPPRNPLSQLLDKVGKWQLIPRKDTEHLPCRVYGAIHLARLFVKLPDFLNATQMPDFKLKLTLKHIDMFVQYLDEHSEWFGEMYYMNDGVSRSH